MTPLSPSFVPAHSREDLEFAIEAFTAVRDELGL